MMIVYFSYIMTELLNTERTYVQDLKLCIDEYLMPLTDESDTSVSATLRLKQAAIFSNIREIYSFHSELVMVAVSLSITAVAEGSKRVR